MNINAQILSKILANWINNTLKRSYTMDFQFKMKWTEGHELISCENTQKLGGVLSN